MHRHLWNMLTKLSTRRSSTWSCHINLILAHVKHKNSFAWNLLFFFFFLKHAMFHSCNWQSSVMWTIMYPSFCWKVMIMLHLIYFADYGTSNNNNCALYSIGDLFNSQLGHQLDGLSFSAPIGVLHHDHFHTKYTSHQSSFQWWPVRLQELCFWIPLIWSAMQMPEYQLLTRLLR